MLSDLARRLSLVALLLVTFVAGCTVTVSPGAGPAATLPPTAGAGPSATVPVPTAIPQRSPDVRGHIAAVEPGGSQDSLARLFVEGSKDPDTLVDKASVTISATTTIRRRTAEDTLPATVADLLPGTPVEVWFEGPVLESYPPRAWAGDVLITGAAIPPTATAPAEPAGTAPPSGTPAPATAAPSADGGSWTRRQFGDAWDVAIPEGWAVDAAGAHEGAVELQGPFGGHVYRLQLSYPIGILVGSLDAWVEEQLGALTPEQRAGLVISPVTFQGAEARRVLNVPGSNGLPPSHRVYIWRLGDRNPRLITVSQVDDGPNDPVAAAVFLERFLAEQPSAS